MGAGMSIGTTVCAKEKSSCVLRENTISWLWVIGGRTQISVTGGARVGECMTTSEQGICDDDADDGVYSSSRTPNSDNGGASSSLGISRRRVTTLGRAAAAAGYI